MEITSPLEEAISLSSSSLSSKALTMNLASETLTSLLTRYSLSSLSCDAALAIDIASRILDLPQPLGPIITLKRPNGNSRLTMDLKFCILMLSIMKCETLMTQI